MSSNTPKVAHRVTNSSARIRRNHNLREFAGRLAVFAWESEFAGAGGSASEEATVEMLLGSAVTRRPSQSGPIEPHRIILRPQGFDALGYISIINVAAIHLEKIIQRRRTITCRLE